jgi:hypothetical protein
MNEWMFMFTKPEKDAQAKHGPQLVLAWSRTSVHGLPSSEESSFQSALIREGFLPSYNPNRVTILSRDGGDYTEHIPG